MKLDKKLVDEVIRLTMKYFETGSMYYLPRLNRRRQVLEECSSWQTSRLVYDLARYTQESGNGTYDDIYNALAVFDIIVEEKEKEND